MPILKTAFMFAIAVLLGVAVSTAGAQAQSAPKAATLSVDALVHYFEAVVFGPQPAAPSAGDVIVKWPREIIALSLEEPHAKIDPAKLNTFLAMVKTHVATLGHLTGKKFKGARTTADADIQVFFVRRADMGKIYGPDVDPKAVAAGAAAGECYSIRWRKTASELFKAITVVNVDRDPALTNSCLLKELTQNMGLPHDNDAMRPSIFSKGDHLKELSLQDQILIQTLYDPRMKAGLSRAEALKLAPTIISGLGKPVK